MFVSGSECYFVSQRLKKGSPSLPRCMFVKTYFHPGVQKQWSNLENHFEVPDNKSPPG